KPCGTVQKNVRSIVLDKLIKSKRGSIKGMNFQEEHSINNEYVFKVLDSEKIVGTALVKKMHDQEGEFWHLDDLKIQKENRRQGYGRALVKHLIKYLWEINKLRIRVHPAVGEQAMESILEARQNLSEGELDEMDRQLEQKRQKPNFWESQKLKQQVFNSKDLKKWYRKQGFTIDDPDGKHLWCHP
ncbi:MAG: GNAT family N-acetyltransferase, partial [Phormidesmis sp. CAN_BIN44]|nr:GNAT family N-acetyltransferase [Phormidesmis sp. CAN_BIN44]